jgi:hypothetical protein
VATEAVADIGRDRLPKGNACAVTVELRDEHRQRVLMVTVSMEIHRMDPAPELLRAGQPAAQFAEARLWHRARPSRS